ncbi:PREDICTED: uncharacterized protein LOC105151908 isoform X2 [Acromyrmex echinatior]|uniref:uncharacterized protein LOC105151908 isoform X2 n=1 Tax=Acromyrmex echinatior TaxID=103372 RepID=UPI000580F06F|nr:PREDICTED: uncharacterized protein LOC105151908 isoform X2 [Acromyrmex echinatior]
MLVVIPFLACCIIWAIASPISTDISCTISTQYKIGDLKEPEPLLLKQVDNNATIWYPDDDDGTLRIFAGDSIYLACPGKNNYFQKRNYNEVEAVCVKDKVFKVKGVRQHISSLVCKFYPEHHAQYMDTPSCLDEQSSIEIGFNVRDTFIRTIELCRDKKTYTTYYTKFTMTKMIKSNQRNYPRPFKFLVGKFYPWINMDYLYKFETQLDTLARILNSIELAKKRLKKSLQFLSRGHLVAKTDFVYGSQQRSTFWYLNTAPQWQTFNAGNWNFLEISIRHFAASRRLDLDVYTGVHGQMTMEDIHNEQQPVYLAEDIISVPKFYWKVIYDPLSKCDISERIEWLNWEPSNITLGISYACSVDDLRKALPVVPLLDVIDILM